MVVRYSFVQTIRTIFNWRFTNLPLSLPYSDRCGKYASFSKKNKVWLNVFLKVLDISMETINQKYENLLSMNFVRARSVLEDLMPTPEIMMYGKENMQE